MATNNMVPYSNPSGNNQTTPNSTATPILTLPSASSSSQNPFVPLSASSVTGTGTSSGTTVPNAGGLTQSSANTTGTTGALTRQLTDIYGKGVGGAEASLLENMSGTDSTVLQEYISSLAPQEATAQAGVNAALGAGGVSSNSSVQGLADASLQAQEFSAISGESANLTQSQESLTAQLLTGMQPAAQSEVASSAWTDLASVMNNITGDVGNLSGGSYTYSGTKSSSVPSTAAVGTQGTDAVSGSTGANDLTDMGSSNLDMGETSASSDPAFV